MSGFRGKNAAVKAQAVTSLLAGVTVAQVSQQAGVHERTVFRWLREPGFMAELHRQERQVLDACSWRLVSLTKMALDALRDVLETPAAPGANVKRLCAVSVLELLLKFREQQDFSERLSQLEERLGIE